MPSFSAALLVGGQSRRMGRDKALLPVPGSGEVLWQRQLAVLAELRPAEIFWSGPSRPGMPADVQIVPDKIADAGPLAGLSACLEKSQSELLVVLAVDLPRITSGFLWSLLGQSSANAGAIIRCGDRFEPLAAVYPKSVALLAARQLERKRYALQDLITEAIKENLLRVVPSGKNAPSDLFTNWNSPEDLTGAG